VCVVCVCVCVCERERERERERDRMLVKYVVFIEYTRNGIQLSSGCECEDYGCLDIVYFG